MKAGSSQPGKMRRASAGSSWLEIIRLRPCAGRVVDHEQPAAKSIDVRGEADAKLMRAGIDGVRRKRSVTVSAAASAMIWLAGPSSPSIAAVSTVMFTALSTIRSVGSATVDVHDLGAGDGELVQIRLQVERVVDRRHGLRQLCRASRQTKKSTRHDRWPRSASMRLGRAKTSVAARFGIEIMASPLLQPGRWPARHYCKAHHGAVKENSTCGCAVTPVV